MAKFKDVSPQEFHEKLTACDNDVACIDVRTTGEHADTRIKGVVNIPLDELSEHVEDLKKYKEVYIHCASGNRSRMACETLAGAGLANVYNVAGGIAGWRAQGLPVVCTNGGKTTIPIMRQVMITAGGLVVFGLLAGAVVHPLFNLVTWFVGCGLIYGGTTGKCLMMRLLLKASWNKGCHETA